MPSNVAQMDNICKVFIVLGVVVLLVMFISDTSNLPPPRQSQKRSPSESTCGAMRSKANASAKRVGGGVGLVRGRTDQAADKPAVDQEFLTLSDPWMNDTVKACEHEVQQDEGKLQQDFSWEVDQIDPSVNEKFKAISITEQDVKRKANIRAINPDMEYEAPTQAKTLGLTNPVHSIYHKNGAQQVNFGQSCSWFHASDAYYDARRRMARCNCLSEDCDACNGRSGRDVASS